MRILLSLIALTLFSCEKLKYGTIDSKWYEPESETLIPIMIPMSDGKNTYYTTVWYWVTDNEDWCIKVTGTGTKGNTITRTLYVSKAQYDTLTQGKFICIDRFCTEDENNTKKEKIINHEQDIR